MNSTFIRFQHVLLILFFFISSLIQVSAQYPSDSAKISLLTLSPGSETYSAFGHSAIHVADKRRGIDFVYNYGTFDFATPNFYPKFIFGHLMYFLSISDFRDFFLSYKRWGQAMWEQELNLTNKEKWQLVQNLQTNYQEENRYYRYGFFRDNCSTRIRDIIEKSVDGKVIYDANYIKNPESFRNLVAPYFEHRDLWTLFGLDLLFGKGNDNTAELRDYMFLPDNLMNLFATAKITGNNVLRNLSQKPVELFPTTLIFPEPNPLTKPTNILWFVFAMVCIFSFLEYKKTKNGKWLDVILFGIIGLLGLLFAALMIGTLHKELLNNYNIIWANPVNIIFCIGLFFRSKPLWLKILMKAYGILLIIFIPASFLLTQVIPAAAYPLMAILLVRIIKIIYTKR